MPPMWKVLGSICSNIKKKEEKGENKVIVNVKIKYKYIIKYAINMQIREYIENLDRTLILDIHCLCDHCLGPSGHKASDGLRCPAQTGRRLECVRHYYHGR